MAAQGRPASAKGRPARQWTVVLALPAQGHSAELCRHPRPGSVVAGAFQRPAPSRSSYKTARGQTGRGLARCPLSGSKRPLSRPSMRRPMGRGAPCEFASAPQDFSPAARSLWSSLWQLPQIKESDRLSVERLCRLEHEAASLRAELAKTGPILKRPVQNARGEIIAHETVPSPTLLPLRKIGSELAVLCDALGLTP